MPKTVKHVQSFLGLTGFFLEKKSSGLNFGEKEKVSFNLLKRYLSTKTILHLFNPDLYTDFLHTDAFIDGYGAITKRPATSS